MSNHYLSVLYKHNSSEKWKCGVKNGGDKHTIAPPIKKVGGTSPPPPPPLPTPVPLIEIVLTASANISFKIYIKFIKFHLRQINKYRSI